jgi:hypothetical protein
MKPWGNQASRPVFQAFFRPPTPSPHAEGWAGEKRPGPRRPAAGVCCVGPGAAPSGCTRLFGLRHLRARPCRPSHPGTPRRPFVTDSLGDRWLSPRIDTAAGWRDRPRGRGPGRAARAPAAAGRNGSGSRHGAPSRSRAQQRTSSRRASATTACLRRALPPRVSRAKTALAQALSRSMAQAACTSSFRSTAGQRRVIRPRRSVSPDWNCRGTRPP